MLPIKHRIYIMEGVSKSYTNPYLVDRLSLAYFKNGDKEKAYNYLKESFEKGIVDIKFYKFQLEKLKVLEVALEDVRKLNSNISESKKNHNVIIVGSHIVSGFPSSKDVFDAAKAVKEFKEWFESTKDKYPEFINLFFCLMMTDDRMYI